MDNSFLQQAIQNSRDSFKAGNFPAGAVVVKDGQVIASEISSPYPSLFHADSKAATSAYQSIGPLTGATLYVGLEPCLMCMAVAYWAGIRTIVYAVPKSKVSGDYYETHEQVNHIAQKFNEPIQMIHVPEMQEEALEVIRSWEAK